MSAGRCQAVAPLLYRMSSVGGCVPSILCSDWPPWHWRPLWSCSSECLCLGLLWRSSFISGGVEPTSWDTTALILPASARPLTVAAAVEAEAADQLFARLGVLGTA